MKLSICSYPGCMSTSQLKYCNNHKAYTPDDRIRARQRQSKRKRNTGSATWKRMRKLQLTREPYCRSCSSMGVLSAATVVDHIDGNTYNENHSNLQSLCKTCHDRKTMKENRK